MKQIVITWFVTFVALFLAMITITSQPLSNELINLSLKFAFLMSTFITLASEFYGEKQ